MARTEIGVYYIPHYHVDPLSEQWHGADWTEWELVKAASPRFRGHEQPKVPMWGYEDESDPAVMARKIDAAADHGIASFIFDWYWYEGKPYLNGALERGLLAAGNRDRLKFALMWANHDWFDVHPAPRNFRTNVLADGRVGERRFVEATDYMIRHYFGQPNYWRVGGGLYFSIYELAKWIEGFGSVADTRRILDEFRGRVRAAGLGELHLNAVVRGIPQPQGAGGCEHANALLAELAFDSVTSYAWVHHQPLPHFPTTDYELYRELSIQDFDRYAHEFDLPYYPNVSAGWDTGPRTVQTDVFDCVGYPYTPILTGNTPDAFRRALLEARRFLDQGLTKPRVLTIHAWNDWTEGSYLEPDVRHGYGYLKSVREVFGES